MISSTIFKNNDSTYVDIKHLYIIKGPVFIGGVQDKRVPALILWSIWLVIVQILEKYKSYCMDQLLYLLRSFVYLAKILSL